MSSLLKSVAAAAVIVCAPGVAAAQSWSDFGEAEGRELIAVENGVVNEVVRDEDGVLKIFATFDGWMAVMVIGTDCEGQGAKQRCTSLGLNGLFEVDDAARSQTLERDLSFQYVADMALDEDFVIHRQIELQGGASLANIRAQLDGFIVVGEILYKEIWPEKATAPTKGGR